MNTLNAKTLFSLAICLSALFGQANAQEHDANVLVHSVGDTGAHDYYYEVQNHSETAVVSSFTIGYDYFHGVPELSTEPVDIYSPAGWEGELVFTEESIEFEVKWVSSSEIYDISPGDSLTGFGFRVDSEQVDSDFTTAHFTVIFGDSTVSSNLVQIDDDPTPRDTTAPVISVTLSPTSLWPPNKKMVKISASVDVVDNQDPSPVVTLESIICNDCPNPSDDILSAEFGSDDRDFSVRSSRLGKKKEGRVYEVTYSAVDASGNKGMAVSTVVVPHDQRKN